MRLPHKTCPRCKEHKPCEAFGLKSPTRLKSWCRDCHNEARRGKPRETPEQRLRRKLKDEYGLTLEQYAALLEAQNGVCAICAKRPASGSRLCVDHCHATGVVRALLCNACNLMIGVFEINRTAASRYLATYGHGNPLLEP